MDENILTKSNKCSVFNAMNEVIASLDDDSSELFVRYFVDKRSVNELCDTYNISYAGIRTAELAALRFEDIKGNKLHVQRQEIKYKDIKGSNVHLIVEYTKTDAKASFFV